MGNNNAIAAILPKKSRRWEEGGRLPQVIWLHCLQTTAVTEQKRLDESEAAADQVHLHSRTQLTLTSTLFSAKSVFTLLSFLHKEMQKLNNLCRKWYDS